MVALDCEMMEVEGGLDQIGRVSIVNHHKEVLYDTFVKNTKPVIDYRTKYSGLTKSKIQQGKDFTEVIQEIQQIIGKNTIVVGHGIDNDLKLLQLYVENIIDTSYLYLNTDGYKINLGILSRKWLNR